MCSISRLHPLLGALLENVHDGGVWEGGVLRVPGFGTEGDRGLSQIVSFEPVTLASSRDVVSLGPTDDLVDDRSE
jgi:hypothetical protein